MKHDRISKLPPTHLKQPPGSAWEGTNDTPPSGEWSPTNNGAPSNMVQLTADVYDNGGVGDGNLTQETQYPGLGATARVNQFYFDWRDRQMAEKDGIESSETDLVNRPIYQGKRTRKGIPVSPVNSSWKT